MAVDAVEGVVMPDRCWLLFVQVPLVAVVVQEGHQLPQASV